MSVTVCRKHFEDSASEFEDGDIEGTATKVEYGNLHVLMGLVDTIGKCSGGRFVDDTLHFKSGNLSGLLRSLTLRIGEVCRYGDDSFRNLLSEIVFGGLLHLLEHHCRNLLRSVVASVDSHAGHAALVDYIVRNTSDFLLHLVPVLTHEALDRVHGLLGVGDSLALGRVAHLTFAFSSEAYDRGGGALAFAVGDDDGLVALEYRYAGVSSS